MLTSVIGSFCTQRAKDFLSEEQDFLSYLYFLSGGLSIPSAMLGIMAGGMILRRLNLSVKASAILCSGAVLLAIVFALPLLFLGCPTQNVAGINYNESTERQDLMYSFYREVIMQAYTRYIFLSCIYS